MVLRVYEKLHKPAEVLKKLRRMKQYGEHLDYPAYNALVDLYNRLPEGDTATELLGLMRDVGLVDKAFLTTVVSDKTRRPLHNNKTKE